MAQDLSWKFSADGAYLGWQPANFQVIEVVGGGIRGTTSKFSRLYSPEVSLDAMAFQTFTFVAKTDRSGTGHIIFKSTGETLDRGLSIPEHHAVPFVLIGDGKFHAYDVNLSKCHYWKGIITGLRFDITYTPGTNFEIASCRFMPKSENEGIIPNSGFEVMAHESQTAPEIWSAETRNGGLYALKPTTDGSGHVVYLSGSGNGSFIALSSYVEYDYPGLYNLKLDCKPDRPIGSGNLTVRLEFADILDHSLEGNVEFQMDLSGLNNWKTFSNSFIIPRLAATGKVELRWTASSANSSVSLDNIVLTLEKEDTGDMAAETTAGLPLMNGDDGPPIKYPKVRYENTGGAPVIYIDETPHSVMNSLPLKITDANSGMGNRRLIELCRDNNVHLYFVEAGTIKITSDGGYDFADLDQTVGALLAIDPDAHAVISAVLDGVNNAGLREWNEKYPDEVVVLADGTTNLAMYLGGSNKVLSMASEVWMNLAEDLMRKLIRHVRGRRYAERIIGFSPYSGVTWEWMYWGCGSPDPNKFPDYSKPYQKAFQDWALAKYGSLSSINQAWQKVFSTFGQVCIPTKEERTKIDALSFLKPKNSQYLIDYHQFHSELVANNILRLAKATKEETHGDSLFGTYYGYVTYAMYYATNKTIGHLALKKVLDSPDVDFLMSPSRYEDRAVGGSSGFMTTTDSVALHNKLWIDQADLRTVHAGTEQAPETRVDTLLDSKAVMARHFANCLVNGCSQQWYDFSNGWMTGDPRLMQWVGRFQQIEKDMMDVKRGVASGNSSIAVIVDEVSTYYTAFNSNINLEMVHSQYRNLANTGVGFDTYLLGDLEKMPPYKCYLFLNTFRMTDAQRGYVDQQLKRDKRVLIFAYAAGMVDNDNISVDGVSRLTGINMKMFNELKTVLVQPNGKAHPIGKYLDESLYGFAGEYGPWFAPMEGDVLGTINGMNQPGLVVKNNADWTCVYSSAAPLPAALVRGIAEYAGITVVNSSDMAGEVTYVGDGIIAIHSLCGGERELTFPFQDGIAKELISKREFAIKNGKTNVNLAPRSTSIFNYSDGVKITLNKAPVVNAGPDISMTMPNEASLMGSVSDDGLPTGLAMVYNWSMVSGAGKAIFSNATAMATTASFSSTGTYVLRLTANDGALSGADEVQVAVNSAIPINQAPTVNAGAPMTVTLPNAASLSGSASDDGLPVGGRIAYFWSKTSGVGTVTFSNATRDQTTAVFSIAGAYILNLEVSDGALSASSNVTVLVNPAPPVNQAPVVNAGSAITVTLPNTASLNGSASDDGLPVGSVLTCGWTKASGAGTVTFAAPDVAQTTASFSVAGFYVLNFKVSDGVLSESGNVSVQVNPNPDSDGDGMLDTWEVAHGLNPSVADAALDADDDGLSNLQEYQSGTDPQKADSDSDGLPDGWEVAHHLSPLTASATGDADGDGINNLQEYQRGIDPERADSVGDSLPDKFRADSAALVVESSSTTATTGANETPDTLGATVKVRGAASAGGGCFFGF